MNLASKFFLVLLLSVFTFPENSFAQEDSSKQNDDKKNNKLQNTKKVRWTFAPSFPIPLGDNFLSKAYDVKRGWHIQQEIYLYRTWLLGGEINCFKANISEPELVGNFEESRIWHLYFYGGRRFPVFSIAEITLNGGIGHAVYANRSSEIDNFNERGLSLKAQANLHLKFGDYIGIQLGVSIFQDYLNTKTAAEIEDFFDTTSIILLSTGVSFTF